MNLIKTINFNYKLLNRLTMMKHNTYQASLSRGQPAVNFLH